MTRGLAIKLAGLIVVASFLVGCGSGYPLVPVSGRITIDGKPLTNASIFTQPIGKDTATPGPGSAAVTDENGEFELELQTEDIMGAVPGEVRIRIVENDKQRAPDDDRSVAFKRRVPPEYYEGLVTYTIPPEGTDAMDFELKSKKRR